MSIVDLILNFRDGATKGKASGGRVRIEGDKLINYDTTIAIRTKEGIKLNCKKYSMTTSRLQNTIRAYCNIIEEYEGEEATIYCYW